jgi:hypothetical protein
VLCLAYISYIFVVVSGDRSQLCRLGPKMNNEMETNENGVKFLS